MYALLKSLLLPPGMLFLLLLGGLIWWRRRFVGRALVFAAASGLLLLSLPIFSNILMEGLEPYPALTGETIRAAGADAIVVLGAGRRTQAAEYGGDTVGPLTLQRIRYGAWLQRRSGLPLILSGGAEREEARPLAELMRETLENEFGASVLAVENASGDTRDNARMSADVLRGLDFERVFLVSHAWHLPRAVAAFERAGVRVIPAPTDFGHDRDPQLLAVDFMPSSQAFRQSYFALHEYLGRVWYALRAQNGF